MFSAPIVMLCTFFIRYCLGSLEHLEETGNDLILMKYSLTLNTFALVVSVSQLAHYVGDDLRYTFVQSVIIND